MSEGGEVSQGEVWAGYGFLSSYHGFQPYLLKTRVQLFKLAKMYLPSPRKTTNGLLSRKRGKENSDVVQGKRRRRLRFGKHSFAVVKIDLF